MALKLLLADAAVPVYLCVVLASVAVWIAWPARAASLFVWGCSLPLSAFGYLLWIHDSGGALWSWPLFAFALFALAQAGWLGAAFTLLGAVGRSRLASRTGVVFSILSVAGNGVFVGAILIFGYGSS